MKITQKYISITAAIIGLTVFNSCADRFENEIPYPNDVTFNELALDRFTYDIPDAPFTAEASETGEKVTVNVSKNTDGTYSGFALSNKNFRSYPWELSPTFEPAGGLSDAETQDAINTTAFSVYTDEVNRTENYLVGNTNDDNAYFTLSSPTIVEHILVANTSYNALLTFYGSIYSDDLDTDTQMYDINGANVSNPNIENPDEAVEGVFTLPGVDGTLNTLRLQGFQVLEKIAAGEAAGDIALAAYIQANPSSTQEEQDEAYQEAYDVAYDALAIGAVTLTIEGFLNGASVGSLDVYLALLEGVDAENPDYAYTITDWRRVELSSFGEVDKVLFKMSSSYVNPDGSMVYPSTFCLDGIRLQ